MVMISLKLKLAERELFLSLSRAGMRGGRTAWRRWQKSSVSQKTVTISMQNSEWNWFADQKQITSTTFHTSSALLSDRTHVRFLNERAENWSLTLFRLR